MDEVRLAKKDVSEEVVRKALYWASEVSSWELKDDSESWLVSFPADDPAIAKEFHRILNDFLLRERLDRSTKGLRLRIVQRALARIARAE